MDDVISRRAVIKTVKNVRDVCDTESLDDYRDLLVECFKVLPSAQPELKELSEWKADFKGFINALDMPKDDYNGIMEYIDELPSVQPEQRWIPCSERLPEDEKKNYWVCTDTGYQCECRWTNINHIWTDLTTNWHWHIMDIPQYSAVIAWMPLPEPWKEGETDG